MKDAFENSVAKLVFELFLEQDDSLRHAGSEGSNTTPVIRKKERKKEMFYLTTHSTHFIYGYMASDMVKDHSDSEKGNPLSPHRLLLSISSKGSFICTIPQTG